MKILLFGADGQVGWELQRSLATLGSVEISTRGGVGHRTDLTDPDQLAALVKKIRPEVVINAAAFTAVDRAEAEPGLARQINAVAPGVLAKEARDVGAFFIHYSTDYVFSGEGLRPWREEDTAAPVNTYGQTKWEGEEAVRSSGCPYWIFRTSWIYSARGGNFPKTLLRLAAERESLQVVDDQVGSPTPAWLVAEITAQALRFRANAEEGTYHLACTGEISWHGLAVFLCRRFRAAGGELMLREISPVASRDYSSSARRPLNSRLDTSKLQRDFGLHLPAWQHGVERFLSEYK